MRCSEAIATSLVPDTGWNCYFCSCGDVQGRTKCHCIYLQLILSLQRSSSTWLHFMWFNQKQLFYRVQCEAVHMMWTLWKEYGLQIQIFGNVEIDTRGSEPHQRGSVNLHIHTSVHTHTMRRRNQLNIIIQYGWFKKVRWDISKCVFAFTICC